MIYDCDQQFKCIYSHSCEDKTSKEKYAKGLATFECTYLCVGMGIVRRQKYPKCNDL